MAQPISPVRRANINELADRIAGTLDRPEQTVRQASSEMGISLSAARAYFTAICHETGSQSIGKWRSPWPPTSTP